ncbi:MAG: hypothetical protein JWM37_337 [Candidatus Saccharibacteria bacterium]|nr:hypothetical protein [Candidatus Saccharibacteria bacterium]
MLDATRVQVAAMVGLGEGNKGNIGPSNLEPQVAEQAIADIGDEKYVAPPSDTWICVDGRTRVAGAPTLEVVPHQIAGGIPFTDAASRFMRPVESNTKHSAVVVDVTKKAVAAGKTVFVHGDDNVGETDEESNKAGCGANKELRNTLRDNARNAHVVAPFAWEVGKGLGIGQHLTEADVNQLIIDGNDNAENDSIWDITPQEAVEIAIESGAQYEVYSGPHREATIRADMTDGAFDKDAFVADHTTPEGIAQAFAASFGAYKKYKYEQVLAAGGTEREAALETMGALLYNISVCKALNDDSTEIAVITKAA